jgi:DNA-directed RNA polymerase subunit RPC12/RpoP
LEVSIMTFYEVGTIALVMVLAGAATAAIFVGLLNWMGAFYVVRCAACHHLTTSSANAPRESCPHCRHPALFHPMYAVRHPRSLSEVRVVGDRLRY